MHQHANHKIAPNTPPEIEETQQAVSKPDRGNVEQISLLEELLDGVKEEKPMMSDEEPKGLSLLIKAGMFISLISIAAAFTFVTWLWWTPQDNDVWRSWVLANRLQSSVTLASVIIRTAVGTLAATATAMIASVAVERRGVHLHAIAQVSAARFSGSGPLSLGILALRPSRLDIVVRLILLLLILSTFAVQFISTLLVSDLQQDEVISFARSIPNTYAVTLDNEARGGFLLSASDNYWRQRLRFAETFAEYSEAGLVGEGIDDTGPTVRAFLPFTSKETREAISSFSGMARVTDSRVICLRPIISNLTICEIKISDSESDIGICGVLQIDSSMANAAGLNWPEKDVFTFGCPLPFSETAPKIWQVCQNHTIDSVLTSSEWSLYDPSGTDDIRLLWDARLQGAWQSGKNQPWPLNSSSTVDMLNSTANGSWTVQAFKVTHQHLNITERHNLKMTMCAQSKIELASVRHLEIHASRSPSLSSQTARAEPNYKWTVDPKLYITETLRKQLNAATKASLSLRPYDRDGTLAIDQQRLSSSIADVRSGKWVKNTKGRMMNNILSSLFYRSETAPIMVCSSCFTTWNRSYVPLDDLHIQLFEDTLEETGSPARALQALYFTLERSVYHDKLSSYASSELSDEEAAVAEIMTFRLTQIPKHCRGYWAVAGILTAFFTIFASAVWLYRPMRYSLPGNSWHAIAQMSESAQLTELLCKARLSTDEEIEQMIEGTAKPPPDPDSCGSIFCVNGSLQRAKRRSKAVFQSVFASGPEREVPRFVLREGVFVRASGEEAYTELKASGIRRRLARKDSWSDRVD